jgi:outer membrane receptor protein involved in Fe transport
MRRRSTLLWQLALLAVAAALAAVPAASQTVTGTIIGRVADSSGAVLPGVAVTISSPQLIGGTQGRTTGPAGEYRFPALPPGTYTVAFELAGFGGSKRDGVILDAGATAAVDVQLSPAQVSENVTVEGESAMVDVKSAQLRETADAALIENVPTGRTYVDVFNLMPGVVYGKYNVATTGTNSVHGGTVRNNVFSLDGVNLNDPLVAYPGTDVNLEMIQEVQITTAGMSAEFGSASGAVFNVITKSGSNDIHGQVNGYFRDEGLQADNVTDELRAKGIRAGNKLTRASDWGASFGGPFKKDRLWYYVNYQKLNETRTMINFPPDIKADQDAVFGKITAQVSSRNRLDTFYQYRLRYDEPFQPDINTQDPKTWRRQRQSNNTFNGKWTSTLSDRTFLEARGSIANQRRFTGFPNATETDYGYIDQSTGLISGGWYRELARPGYRNTRTVKADLTHFAPHFLGGAHEVKFGASYDWLINEETREWLAGARVQLLLNGVPDRIQLSNAPVNQSSNVNQFAVYLQDQWSISPRFTLNLGARFETLEGWYPEGASGGVNFPKETFAETRNVVNFSNVAPRVGLVYDIQGNRKTVLRATFGKFYNQVYVGEFSAANPFGLGSRVYRWTDMNGDRIWQPGEEGQLISDSTGRLNGRIDPSVKPSYDLSYTAGIERELMPDLAVGATFIMKKEYDLAETVNGALPFDTAYVPVTLTNPLTSQPITVYALNPAFTGVPTLRLYTNPGSQSCSFCPDLVRKYHAVELTLRKRMRNKWQLFASYVYSKAEGNKGEGHNESQGNVFGSPNTLVNAFGRLNLERPHQFKMQGTYEAPWQVLLSASFTAQSGLPWARQIRFLRAASPLIVVESSITVNAEPIGSQRFDTETDLSMRAEKKFDLGGHRRLGVIADVFNLLNSSTVLGVQQTRVDHVDFGKPGEIPLPRTLRLGARFEF